MNRKTYLLIISFLLGAFATLACAFGLSFTSSNPEADSLWSVWIPAGVFGLLAFIYIYKCSRNNKKAKDISSILKSLWREIEKLVL